MKYNHSIHISSEKKLLVCGHPFYSISTKYAILHQPIAPNEQKLFQMYKYELPLCTPKFPTCNPLKHNLQPRNRILDDPRHDDNNSRVNPKNPQP